MWGREGGGEYIYIFLIIKEESVFCRYGFLEDFDCRKVVVIGLFVMLLFNIY